MSKIEITETQALQILAYLENTVPCPSSSDIRRRALIDQAHEISWDLAEVFNFDLNDGSVDPITLRFVKFDRE